MDIAKERALWQKELIGKFIKVPKICPVCNHGAIYLINQENEINPILGKCNSYKCNYNLYLRKGTIFEFHKHTPASVLYNIIILWIHEELNVKKIAEKLNQIYTSRTIDKRVVYSFLINLRIAIANYIRNIYSLDPLAYKNANQFIAVDESLFTHNQGHQQLVVGLINTETNDFRIELVDSRDQTTLKNIITKHVLIGNSIVSDSWSGYNFLNAPNSGYNHIVHNHSRGNFGTGLESTSRIESIWGQLKFKIKNLYHSIPSKNFVYFLREAEYRLRIKNLNKYQKLEDLSILLSIVGNGLNNEYLSEENLKNIDYDTLFDEDEE